MPSVVATVCSTVLPPLLGHSYRSLEPSVCMLRMHINRIIAFSSDIIFSLQPSHKRMLRLKRRKALMAL